MYFGWQPRFQLADVYLVMSKSAMLWGAGGVETSRMLFSPVSRGQPCTPWQKREMETSKLSKSPSVCKGFNMWPMKR